MTIEERAQRYFECEQTKDYYRNGPLWKRFIEELTSAIKEEKERCAKIADKYFRHMVSRVIAEEIRNREA
ncbi:MAG: hypothetical protein QQN55_08730 [Nitrosopumilus sp.]